MPKEKIYCSLDIETSGFDPLKNEVLEVGFVFFELVEAKQNAKGGNAKEAQIKIIEEYTRVFKPNGEVPPAIFGLTGITQAELDGADKFSEYRDELQKKLGEAIIVGHNIIFDTKFLEGFGLKFSGQTIDTLDLVQWILPAHHSYNLESLMHAFGISHKDAHRALADCKATLKLLEKLLRVYQGFPEELKTKIINLIKTIGFAWEDLLTLELEPLALPEGFSILPISIAQADNDKFKFQTKNIYNFPLTIDYPLYLAGKLKKNKAKSLLVLPKARQILELFRAKLINKPIFLPEQTFNAKKFASFTARKNLSPEEVKFALKILVWQKINWQTQTFLDLNLSFFGGQFKDFISGGELAEDESAQVIACDHQVFLQLADLGLYHSRQAVICGLSEFENSITSRIGAKISWGYINYLLKSFYNPENPSFGEKYEEAVTNGLGASDLFFGLIGALLQTDPPGFMYYKISAQTEYEEKYQKIKGAAENFILKLAELNKVLRSEAVTKFAEDLSTFFQTEENRVKWIELAENRCALLSMPLEISGLVGRLLNPYEKLSWADALDKEILPGFFQKRLGLIDYKLTGVEIKTSRPKAASAQGDLFAGVKSFFGGKASKISYHILPKTADASEILNLVTKPGALPAVVLFASQSLVKDFYEQNYKELKTKATLLAQHSSGGSNKIFRNFSIHKDGLLLCTDKFILKHLSAVNAVEPVSKLSAKTVILCRLPFEQFTHPYQEALGQTMANAFSDYGLPRALFNFHQIFKFFYSPQLSDVYIVDAKLSKPYAKVFLDYYQNLPGAKLVK